MRKYRAATGYLTRLGWVSIIGLVIGLGGLLAIAVKNYGPMPSAVQHMDQPSD